MSERTRHFAEKVSKTLLMVSKALVASHRFVLLIISSVYVYCAYLRSRTIKM